MKTILWPVNSSSNYIPMLDYYREFFLKMRWTNCLFTAGQVVVYHIESWTSAVDMQLT